MKRTFLAVFALSFLALSLGAEPKIVFFSDDVPRYEGFGAGGYLINQYGIGDWSDYAAATLGGGLAGEYTLPSFLPHNMDLGLSARAEFAHVFPKSGSTLKKDNDLTLTGGVWLRIPFLLFGQAFALQPELSYGAALHFAEGHNGSKASGLYADQLISFAPALRWMPPVGSQNVEVEFSPMYTLAPEKDHALNQLGFRLGTVWHLNDFVQERKQKEEEKRLAAAAEQQRLEREKQEAELRRLKEEEEARRRAMEEASNEAERQRIAEEMRRAEEERKAAEAEAARIAEEERIKAAKKPPQHKRQPTTRR